MGAHAHVHTYACVNLTRQTPRAVPDTLRSTWTVVAWCQEPIRASAGSGTFGNTERPTGWKADIPSLLQWKRAETLALLRRRCWVACVSASCYTNLVVSLDLCTASAGPVPAVTARTKYGSKQMTGCSRTGDSAWLPPSTVRLMSSSVTLPMTNSCAMSPRPSPPSPRPSYSRSIPKPRSVQVAGARLWWVPAWETQIRALTLKLPHGLNLAHPAWLRVQPEPSLALSECAMQLASREVRGQAWCPFRSRDTALC